MGASNDSFISGAIQDTFKEAGGLCIVLIVDNEGDCWGSLAKKIKTYTLQVLHYTSLERASLLSIIKNNYFKFTTRCTYVT